MHARVCATNANWNSYYSHLHRFRLAHRNLFSFLFFQRFLGAVCSCAHSHISHSHCHVCKSMCQCVWRVANETSFVLSLSICYFEYVICRYWNSNAKRWKVEKKYCLNKCEMHYLDFSFICVAYSEHFSNWTWTRTCLELCIWSVLGACAMQHFTCAVRCARSRQIRRKTNEYSCRWAKFFILQFYNSPRHRVVSWYFRTYTVGNCTNSQMNLWLNYTSLEWRIKTTIWMCLWFHKKPKPRKTPGANASKSEKEDDDDDDGIKRARQHQFRTNKTIKLPLIFPFYRNKMLTERFILFATSCHITQ